MTEWVQTHLPCPDCGSSDALSINSDGWSKCFSCGKNSKVDGECETKGKRQVAKDKSLVPFGEYRALSKRKITEETCKKFGYFVGTFKKQLGAFPLSGFSPLCQGIVKYSQRGHHTPAIAVPRYS